ncbi:ligase-associated DNA damage response endonuclease PdeM [Daejeonella sp.]
MKAFSILRRLLYFCAMISVPLSFNFLSQTLLLLPEKAVFWEEEKTLIIADIHLGKVGHFRKAGIGIPKEMEQQDLALISDLIHEYKPLKIIFLGDLFHSDMNNDWGWLVMWRSLFKKIDMILVLGNHDILNDDFYRDLDFELHDRLEIGPFLFSHAPLKPNELVNADSYVVCGHIHPGVTLKGGARQILTLPCFHFGARQAILPAFGKFTGKVCVKNVKGDQVFGIAKNQVIRF